jgi:hypothetical protein
MRVTVTRKPKKTSTAKRRGAEVALRKTDVAASYNQHKYHKGKQYTGLQVGRGLKWYYDKGEWKDAKITPDLWRIHFAVTKRRAGKAPKGSGAAVGTGYHWFILGHQTVEKLNADDYSTVLSGVKLKIAHKRAGKGSWSVKTPTQRKHLINFLKNWIRQLEKNVIRLEILYKEKKFKGEAIAISEACVNGICSQYEITLNEQHFGMIRSARGGWKMEGVKDQKFVTAIGEAIAGNGK